MTGQRAGRVVVTAILLALLSFTGAGCATLGVMIGAATGAGMQIKPTPTSVKSESPSHTAPLPDSPAGNRRG